MPCIHCIHTWEIDSAIVICIDLIDHVLQLGFRWILAKRTHHRSQFLGGDLACHTLFSIDQRAFHLLLGVLEKQRALTIAVLILLRKEILSVFSDRWKTMTTPKEKILGRILTNRENASLYSETCSSVNESFAASARHRASSSVAPLGGGGNARSSRWRPYEPWWRLWNAISVTRKTIETTQDRKTKKMREDEWWRRGSREEERWGSFGEGLC